MISKVARGFVGVALLGSSLSILGCGSAPADSLDVESADENVATSADALGGNVGVGTTLRTTTGLNLRSGPSTRYAVLLTMPAGALVTVRRAAPSNGFYEISYGSRTGWASGGYLNVASGTPASGSAVRIGGPAVRAHVQAFANAACAAHGCPFAIGTREGHSPTADRAIDMMQARGGTRPTDGGAHGNRIANFGLQGGAYRVLYVIWQQRINSRDGRGWRAMADRGSITQNHYDHVHVSFNP